MYIEVLDTETKDNVFRGNADEFLELNDYDEELELALNKLNGRIIGAITNFTTFLGCNYDIKRIKNDDLIY